MHRHADHDSLQSSCKLSGSMAFLSLLLIKARSKRMSSISFSKTRAYPCFYFMPNEKGTRRFQQNKQSWHFVFILHVALAWLWQAVVLFISLNQSWDIVSSYKVYMWLFGLIGPLANASCSYRTCWSTGSRKGNFCVLVRSCLPISGTHHWAFVSQLRHNGHCRISHPFSRCAKRDVYISCRRHCRSSGGWDVECRKCSTQGRRRCCWW